MRPDRIGRAESLERENQRDIGDAEVGRQPNRSRRVELPRWTLVVIQKIRPVHAQVVVVRSLGHHVIVKPHGVLPFAWIAFRKSPEGINAGVGIGVMIVLEQSCVRRSRPQNHRFLTPYARCAGGP